MMRRPTQDDLIRATDLLEQLAYRYDAKNNPNGFPDVVMLLDLLLWEDTELEYAKQAAAYGPGAQIHTIGRHGLNRPVEQRFSYGSDRHPRLRPELADPLVRHLRALRRSWRSQLANLVTEWAEQARQAANWPQRTKPDNAVNVRIRGVINS